MRVSFLCLVLAFMQGCKHLALGIPFQIKAAIEGEIKGVKVKCEKILEFDQGNWGVMCGVGSGIEIKYRTERLQGEQTKVEFMVGKEKDGQQKIIAAPVMIVKANESSTSATTNHNSNIVLTAESLR